VTSSNAARVDAQPGHHGAAVLSEIVEGLLVHESAERRPRDGEA
jgi:hypothetical protein